MNFRLQLDLAGRSVDRDRGHELGFPGAGRADRSDGVDINVRHVIDHPGDVHGHGVGVHRQGIIGAGGGILGGALGGGGKGGGGVL